MALPQSPSEKKKKFLTQRSVIHLREVPIPLPSIIPFPPVPSSSVVHLIRCYLALQTKSKTIQHWSALPVLCSPLTAHVEDEQCFSHWHSLEPGCLQLYQNLRQPEWRPISDGSETSITSSYTSWHSICWITPTSSSSATSPPQVTLLAIMSWFPLGTSTLNSPISFQEAHQHAFLVFQSFLLSPHWEGPTNQAGLLNKNDFLAPPLGLCMAILPTLNSSSPPGYYSTYSHPWKTWVQTCLEWPQVTLLPAAASFKLQLSLWIVSARCLTYILILPYVLHPSIFLQ